MPPKDNKAIYVLSLPKITLQVAFQLLKLDTLKHQTRLKSMRQGLGDQSGFRKSSSTGTEYGSKFRLR